MDKRYRVNYSRKMATGKRLIAYNQIVSESDFRLMVNDSPDSRYGYIIIKAELIHDGRDLDEIAKVSRVELLTQSQIKALENQKERVS